MSSFAERLDNRRKNFKKAVDSEDARRKREDETVQLRKAKKDEQMQKRRMTQEDDSENIPAAAATCNSSTDMPSLVQQAMNSDAKQRFDATMTMRKQLSVTYNPPVQEAIDAGAVPVMVKLLASEDQKLQFEASWVLTNIASGETHQTQAVVDGGAVPCFIQLLSSPSIETREQALWALANIAGDNTTSRDFVMSYDPMTPVLQLIVESEQESKLSILRNAVWALSNLCRGKPQPPLHLIAPALPFLGRLVYCMDADVLADTLWALSYVGDGPSERIDAVMHTGALGKVCEFLTHSDTRIVQPALRVIGNVATGSDTQTDVAIECGVLHQIPKLLAHTKSNIRKEAMWVISNIVAGTKAQLQQVLETAVMPRIVELAASDTAEVRKEAVWVISNAATGGTQEQLKYMADAGAVSTLASTLDQVRDQSTLTTALDAISSFLKSGQLYVNEFGGENPYCCMIEEAGGLSKLEKLQEDSCETVYKRATDILTTFFECEEEVDQIDAKVPEGGFNFGA